MQRKIDFSTFVTAQPRMQPSENHIWLSASQIHINAYVLRKLAKQARFPLHERMPIYAQLRYSPVNWLIHITLYTSNNQEKSLFKAIIKINHSASFTMPTMMRNENFPRGEYVGEPKYPDIFAYNARLTKEESENYDQRQDSNQ